MGALCSNNNNEDHEDYYFDNSRINNINNRSIIKENNSFINFHNNNNLNDTENIYIINQNISKINSIIRGYLFRKKFAEYLKVDLMDFTNELYVSFIELSKNKKFFKIFLFFLFYHTKFHFVKYLTTINF